VVRFQFFIYNPIKAHPCVILCLLSHYASKSVPASVLYVGPRKKKSHKSYISPVCPEGPRIWIFTKVGLTACLSNVIFGKISTGVFILQEVKVSIFPIGN